MAAHIKIQINIQKTQYIHSIKGNYKLGLQFIHVDITKATRHMAHYGKTRRHPQNRKDIASEEYLHIYELCIL